MTFNYTGLRSTASRLITEFGSAMTLSRVSLGTFDNTSGTYASSTTTDYIVTGVVTALDFMSLYMGRGDAVFTDGTVIQAGDKQVLLAVSTTVTPRNGDLLIIGGLAYNIVTVGNVSPSGSNLLHKCLCRK